MGYRRCRYRGLRRNTFDMVMTVAAYNVKRDQPAGHGMTGGTVCAEVGPAADNGLSAG